MVNVQIAEEMLLKLLKKHIFLELVNILSGFLVAVASQHIETESPVTTKLSAQARKPK